MLSEEVKKELDEYNQKKKAFYQQNSNRMAKVHEQDLEDEDSPENAEPDLGNNHTEDSYPMQDSDIEELIESHGSYSAEMASSYHISKHSASSNGFLVDRGASGGLAGADVCILKRAGRKVSVTGIDHHE